MTNSVNKGSTEIEESGFDMDSSNSPSNRDKKVTSLEQKISDEPADDESPAQGKISRSADIINAKKKPIIIGMVLAGIVVIGGFYWDYAPQNGNASSDFEMPLDSVTADEAPIGSEPEKPDFGIRDFSIKQGSDGVLINGHHDLIASMLLQHYPTRDELRQEISIVRGADVSKEELDAFLLSVKNNADDIRQLKLKPSSSVDSSEIRRAIADIRSMVERINEDLDKLKKNSGWYHNRISKLENRSIKVLESTAITNSDNTSQVRRVEMKAQSAWSVNGASENLAFIQNIHSGKRLRVTHGFDIPGCGQVTDISPADQKVTTTTCVISN